MQKSSSFGETKAVNHYKEEYNAPKSEITGNSFQNNVPSRGKGMQLGKKNVENDLINTIKAEEGYNQVQIPSQAMAKLSVTSDKMPESPKEGINLLLEEKLSLVANRDGGIESMEIKGSLILKIGDPSKAACVVSLDLFKDSNIQYMVILKF